MVMFVSFQVFIKTVLYINFYENPTLEAKRPRQSWSEWLMLLCFLSAQSSNGNLNVSCQNSAIQQLHWFVKIERFVVATCRQVWTSCIKKLFLEDLKDEYVYENHWPKYVPGTWSWRPDTVLWRSLINARPCCQKMVRKDSW